MLPASQLKFIENGSNPRKINRIEKELKNIKLNNQSYFVDFQEINTNVWIVGMTVPENHNLHKLLSLYSHKFNVKPYIQFEITFPGSYPFEPPFIRIILPRFIDLKTFVTKEGSICMENITNSQTESGYNPTMSIENLLIAIHSLILSKDDLSIDLENGTPATWDQAVSRFINTSNIHKWDTHKNLKQINV